MIYVIAAIELKPASRDAFLNQFHEIVPLVRAESGCLEYGPTVDVPSNIEAQPDVRADVVTVVEKWESLEALEAHLIAPHMLDFRRRVKALVKSTSLRILEPA